MKISGKILLACLFLVVAGMPAKAMMPAVTESAPGVVQVEKEVGRAKLQYPQLTEGSALMRFRVNGAVTGDIARFREDIAQKEEASGWTRWFVGCADRDVVSILLTESTYYDRAAHPTTYVKCMNFDETGKLISREEILKKVETNPAKMRRMILEQTKAREIPVFENNVEELSEWPKEWYVGNDRKIYFIFQQYDIAPYAAGWIEIAAGTF